MADGGNVEFVEIDGPVVRLKLQGACGSCPASTTTMTMGIERRLKERIPEVLEVEQVCITTTDHWTRLDYFRIAHSSIQDCMHVLAKCCTNV
jgi:hypothetical protein